MDTNAKNFLYFKEKTATITGHRPKSLPWGYDENKLACINFKHYLKKIFEQTIFKGYKFFLTGMAEGFDMIGTEILIELRKIYEIQIIAVIPCLGQEKKWKNYQQIKYQKIINSCDDVIILSNEYYDSCMNDRNKFMIENSNLCIACWNGKPSGTGNTISFAKDCGKEIKIININSFK